MTHTPHIAEHLRRDDKAAKLTDALQQMGISASDIELDNDTAWEAVAKQAGCNPPNPRDPERRTAKLVVRMLREREMDSRRTHERKSA